jgi:hypothetical protein
MIKQFELRTNMSELKTRLAHQLLETVPVNRGKWQAEEVTGSNYSTHELSNVVIHVPGVNSVDQARAILEPDLPWADDHHHERISGVGMNPAPSYKDWPWHSAKEAERHAKDEGRFDHTYPERLWPKWVEGDPVAPPRRGLRFELGELGDVTDQLRKDPRTRQAFLPIWFPEDTGAVDGQRVPCSLGYHFIQNGPQLDVNYFLRSCDLTRHFHNDVYFTMRLLQYVLDSMRLEDNGSRTDFRTPYIGDITIFISNLHLFKADVWRYDHA